MFDTVWGEIGRAVICIAGTPSPSNLYLGEALAALGRYTERQCNCQWYGAISAVIIAVMQCKETIL